MSTPDSIQAAARAIGALPDIGSLPRGLHHVAGTVRPMKPARYLSRSEFAARIGVAPATLNRYKLPPADCLIGKTRGWKPQTVDTWNAARPGSGWRKGKGK